MPTKEAVKTSILSTRWKNLWASVPTIDFDDDLLHAKGRRTADMTSFMNFVERVLQLRDSLSMEKFRLSCRVYCDAYQIRSWISDAIMHDVRELDLSLFQVYSYAIPESMFHSTSLVSLKIILHYNMKFPSYVSFPRLKTLQLTYGQYVDNEYTEILLSGCPVLEELALFTNTFRSNIAISSPSLKSFTICDEPILIYGKFYYGSSYKINIDATNLTNFEYTGSLSNQILLDNVSNLVKACIDSPLDQATFGTFGLLKQLQYVVSLRFCDQLLKSLFHIPKLPNLTHLTLTTEIGTDTTFRTLMDLLSVCLVLQSICFSEGFKCGIILDVNDKMWLLIPICMSNSLKTVTFKNFHGYRAEMHFLKWVLKYACGLEMMDIRWSKTYLQHLKNKKKKSNVRKEIENIEKKAAACVIKFS
ncbi:hypothetical protein LXL04_037459 [Taraxacum kok-saghyz]